MGVKLLLVDDETDLREGLSDLLTLEGFQCAGVGSIAAYQEWVLEHDYDILLLDRNLPDGDGLTILGLHNASRNAPVIIISCEGQLEDRVRGLEADADYYLVKPVVIEELVALLHRFSRRMNNSAKKTYAIDVQRWALIFPDGTSMGLTRNEVKLMACFVDKTGVAIERDSMILALGARLDVYDERRLEVMVRRLRKKTIDLGKTDFPLSTVYGVGYAFNEDLHLI